VGLPQAYIVLASPLNKIYLLCGSAGSVIRSGGLRQAPDVSRNFNSHYHSMTRVIITFEKTNSLRLFSLLSVLALLIPSCKKETQEVSNGSPTLAEMRVNIMNDWQIVRMMSIKPQYGQIYTSPCSEAAIFRFEDDNRFTYLADPLCYSEPNTFGFWEIRTKDSLFIDFNGNPTYSGYEKMGIAKLTKDTMQWYIYPNGRNDSITDEYTLIPK